MIVNAPVSQPYYAFIWQHIDVDSRNNGKLEFLSRVNLIRSDLPWKA